MRIIDFYSVNHKPSLQLRDLLLGMEEEHEVEVVDFDNEVEICDDYDVHQVPTVLFIVNDEIKKRCTGSISKEKLDNIIYQLTAG